MTIVDEASGSTTEVDLTKYLFIIIHCRENLHRHNYIETSLELNGGGGGGSGFRNVEGSRGKQLVSFLSDKHIRFKLVQGERMVQILVMEMIMLRVDSLVAVPHRLLAVILIDLEQVVIYWTFHRFSHSQINLLLVVEEVHQRSSNRW